jgi:hypothetical protein
MRRHNDWSVQPDAADDHPDPTRALTHRLAELQAHHSPVRGMGHLSGVRVGERNICVVPTEVAAHEGIRDSSDVRAPWLMTVVDLLL